MVSAMIRRKNTKVVVVFEQALSRLDRRWWTILFGYCMLYGQAMNFEFLSIGTALNAVFYVPRVPDFSL